jgi:hypothetical protein
MNAPIENPGPRLDAVIAATNARAARVEERCYHVVTGYVLTHRALAKKAIVDMGAVRWFPNIDEYTRMMTGRDIVPGPGVPPPEWGVDDLIAATPPVAVPVPAAVLPAPPVLTAPPSARLLETTEEALGELGCVLNEDIPHNAGWFVPGKPTACSSAYDAIRGLVASLKSGGTVYEGKPAITTIDGALHASEAVARAEEKASSQGDLF